MGSKKLKRKKIKGKKLVNLVKLCRLKNKKYKCFKNVKKIREKVFQQNDISRKGTSKENKYSRVALSDKYISEIKHFAQLREHYFTYLQQIVCDNCIFCSSQLNESTLENISLKLEQHALLASLQADIYEKSILEVISDIKKSTQKKQINEKVKQLLPELTSEEIIQIKIEKSPSLEINSEISTISNNRPNGEIIIDEESNFINNFNYNSVAEEFTNEYSDMYNQNHTNVFNNKENFTNYWCSEMCQTSQNDFNNLKNVLEPTITFQSSDVMPIGEANIVIRPTDEKEKVDPLYESTHQIQQPKSIEMSLNNSEKINENISEEKERAYIAHILEGKDSGNDDRFDSSSDNENDSKENLNDTNLLSRLERMKKIFGVDDEENNVTATGKPKNSSKVFNQSNNRSRRPSIWRHEKVIQLYKYSMISSEMILEKKIKNQKLFLELFGSDSDDEHELEYRSEEKFRTACKERISPWVVKYLMPFYYDKKIIGRNTFKSLGHHISDCIVDEILYPDEWSVKYFVSKFFPPQKKYFCNEDVAAFEYE